MAQSLSEPQHDDLTISELIDGNKELLTYESCVLDERRVVCTLPSSIFKKRVSDLTYDDIYLLSLCEQTRHILSESECCKECYQIIKNSRNITKNNLRLELLKYMTSWLYQSKNPPADLKNYKVMQRNVYHLEHFVLVFIRDTICVYRRGNMNLIMYKYDTSNIFKRKAYTFITAYSDNQFLIYNNNEPKDIYRCYLCTVDCNGKITRNKKVINTSPWHIYGVDHIDKEVRVRKLTHTTEGWNTQAAAMTISENGEMEITKLYERYQHETILYTDNNGKYCVEIDGTELKITCHRNGNLNRYEIRQSYWTAEITNGPMNDYIHLYDNDYHMFYDITDDGTKLNTTFSIDTHSVVQRVGMVSFYCTRYMIYRSVTPITGGLLHGYNIKLNSSAGWCYYNDDNIGFYFVYIGKQDDKLIFATSPTKDGIPVMQYIDLIFT
jgi:hypothetical protein